MVLKHTLGAGGRLRTLGVCGPHALYIGQCGAINGPRPPMERFCEHCRKGKSLKNKYVGRQCRSQIKAIRPGCMPSLPRLIARYGMGCMSMYPIEYVDPREAGERGRFWDCVHTPTANQRIPFGGVDRLVWEMICNEHNDTSEMKTLKARAEHILTKGVCHVGIPTVLRFLTDACGHLHVQLFDKLFAQVKRVVTKEWGFALPRRLVFHVPSYKPHVQALVRKFLTRWIRDFQIPDALRDWLCKAICIVPPLWGKYSREPRRFAHPTLCAKCLNSTATGMISHIGDFLNILACGLSTSLTPF